MSGRTGKIEAQAVQVPCSLSRDPHQKQSLIADAAAHIMLAALASDISIPAHSNVVLYGTVEQRTGVIVEVSCHSVANRATHRGIPTRMSIPSTPRLDSACVGSRICDL